MSIISSMRTDHSAVLAKQFAQLTLGYLSKPESIKPRVLEIPLENLFRLSEMLRYNAFADEIRMGVLAILPEDSEEMEPVTQEESWSKPIEVALKTALSTTYGEVSSKSIEEFQESLREVPSKEFDDKRRRDLRQFLEAFESALG